MASLLLLCLPLAAQSDWRNYSSLDGMAESWITNSTLGPSGLLYLTHGEVTTSTVFDGYRFRSLPSPGRLLTVREAPGGALWALLEARNGLQVLTSGKWQRYELPELRGNASLGRHPALGSLQGLNAAAFLPWRQDRVLLPEPDTLFEFDRASGRLHPLLTAAQLGLGALSALAPSRDGSAWLGAERGLARLSLDHTGSLVTRSIPLPPASGPAVRILECEAGRLYVSTQSSGRQTLWRHDGSSWLKLATGDPGHQLWGWDWVDGAWWQADGTDAFFELTVGTSISNRTTIRRERGISGRLHSVLYQGRGAFTLSTSLGLAILAPQVWRTPPALSSFNRHASAILQARNGDLYIAHDTQLLRRHDGVWRSYPAPPGFDLLLARPYAIAELSSGLIAVGAGPGLLLFSPATNSFSITPHPERQHLEVVGPARDGSLFVSTTEDFKTHRLERFDGARFTTLLAGNTPWRDVVARQVLELSDGTLALLPDRGGFGILDPRSGSYASHPGPKGSTGNPFCALEVSPGRLWLGNRDQILEWSPSGWRTVRERLQSVRSLLKASDGSIYVASGRGLTRFKDGAWITIASAEGLPDGSAYGVFEDSGHNLWVTTTMGVSLSDWDADRDPPETFLSPSGNPSRVAPGSASHFTFTGLDRWKGTASSRLLYSWRVDYGPWSPFQGDQSADLPPMAQGRTHRFEVRAMDRNGNIDPHPTALEFETLLAWYREPGFLFVGLLGLISLAVALALFFQRHRHLARLVEERTTALTESTRLLRQVAATAPGVLYTFEPTPDGGRFPYISPRVSEFCGVDAKSVMADAQALFRLVHPDDLPRIHITIEAAILAGAGWADQFRLIRPDGVEIWLDGNSAPSLGASGQLLWFGLLTDITSRRQMEEARRQSEIRYRDLFNHMHEGFVYARMIFEDGAPVDYEYLAVNDSFYRLTHFPPVVGKRIGELFPGIHQRDPELFNFYGRVCSTGIPEKIELHVETIDMWTSISAYCPHPGHFVGIFDVVTERKKAEAERDRLQEQVIQAQKMESVGRLAGGIAHDFNNLLTVINGYAALASRSLTAHTDAAEAVAEIARAGDRAAALVRQLLIFSRRSPSSQEVIDLNVIVGDLGSTVLRLVGENIRIDTVLGLGPFPISADRHQMGQVLINLLVNARDAMPGGGSVTVETRLLSSHPPVVRLTVRDTGIGMDAETKQRLFEPFFTTKPEGHGTGLGLSVVHGIVTRSGGSISVDSAPGFGSSFHIDLPLCEEPAHSPAPSPATLERGSGSILVVEDQDDVRRFVRAALQHCGYQVLEAESGEAALPLLARRPVDLLLTDVVMPVISGPELARRARALRPGLKVLFMSGYTGAESSAIDEAAAAGAFIQKPFTPAQLAAKVLELLAQPAPAFKVVVADDEPAVRHLLHIILRSAGYEVSEASGGHQALDLISQLQPDILLTDLAMPGFDGSALIRTVRLQFPSVRIIAMSGTNPSPLANSPHGPHAAIPKPIDPDGLLSLLDSLLNSPNGHEK